MTAGTHLLPELGFTSGAGGPHQARSMMLMELTTLLELVPEHAAAEDYRAMVIEKNALGKKTQNNRTITFRHLRNLYSLDPGIALFRVLRRFWDLETAARPLLAFQCAYAHDPLLRASASLVLERNIGEPFTRAEMEEFLKGHSGGVLRSTSVKSFAQNLNGSWTESGFLKGRVIKARAHPWAGPVNAAYGLLTAFLAGNRGEALLNSEWTALLDVSNERLLELAEAASQRGLIRLLRVGSVMEFRFQGYLSKAEEALIHGQS